ncbi:copper oxidase [Geobacillus sp. 47C-IIb]|uniref:multicopper oxidase family protein n=1 Tax=Geobacillus sp. 47C-IIb TaxID=1963026 RepID=UPI0009BE88A0|nr:multicopper oxidase domain-containing protein [Geobacillus sp. 47C-IIb]OQP08703.1 copper oxidase [Geobacillus sp. 47C-IIb]QNU31332.1 multicopper oxidase domain-containing protein [Geobacillus sp. 47C-IIb]
MMKRRRIFATLLFGLIALCLAGCDGDTTMNVGKLTFQNELNIPPLLEPTVGPDGTKHFTLTMQTGTTEFFEGKKTPTWGINGSYLGPTIRVSRGDKVAFDVVNHLPETSTLHWHGMRLPAAMDGGPHQMIEAGSTWNPSWTIEQPAATTWYHPHLHGKTALHVYRGLAGLFLIEDQDSKKLPSNYGVDDIPIIIQDKMFNGDGSFNESMDLTPFGMLGNQILVNGTYDPYLRITSSQVRFRLLNGSNARAYHVGFSDNRSFYLVGNDAGLLPEPIKMKRILLSPGERAEIVVEFKEGEETILHSFAGKDGIENGEFDLVKLIADQRLTAATPLPQTLTSEPPIEVPADAKVRTFVLTTESAINGKKMDMNRIDEVVPARSREIWEITNKGWDHNFHIHDATFTILDKNGELPPKYERGRKDTVFIPSGTKVRLAVDFGSYPDPTTPYMYHCHLLYHEDSGMMGQFVIVEPGTESQVSQQLHRRPHHH